MRTYLQGLTMGLAYVAPIGLQNLFVINSALRHRCGWAMVTAACVIFFDVTLALACFFGVGAVMQRWQWLQQAVLLAGSLVVIFIGAGLLRAKEIKLEERVPVLSLRDTAVSACVVTWFNPQAIIDGTMLLGAFRASLPGGQGTAFIAGVASASCLWFSALALVVSLCRRKISPKLLRGINIVCGVVIAGYGVKLLLSFAAGL